MSSIAPTLRTAAFALAIAGIALSRAADAQTVYKWVDEKGRTHYSESPPPEQKGKAKAVKIDTTPLGGPDAPKPVEKSWKEKELESRQKSVTSAEDLRKHEEIAKAEASKKQRCENAQEALRRLYMQVPVYSRDKDGQRRSLEDQDREAAIAKEKKIVAENC